MTLSQFLATFSEYECEHCVLCRAPLEDDPPYRGHVANGRYHTVTPDSYPYCSVFCLLEAHLRGMRPCEMCNGTQIYHYSIRTYDGYESESDDCSLCPNSRGYFIDGEKFMTLQELQQESYGY